jgi:hypothetical protein
VWWLPLEVVEVTAEVWCWWERGTDAAIAVFLSPARTDGDHRISHGRLGHLGSFPPKKVGHLRFFWPSGVFEKYITKSGVFETFSENKKKSDLLRFYAKVQTSF